MTATQNQIAVLTGDIISSTALDAAQLDTVFATLESCAKAQADWVDGPLRFTRHRGDGWQVALTNPKYALRSALTFRAALRACDPQFDSYIAIATGAAPANLSNDLNTQNDAAFIASGQLLDQLKMQNSESTIGHADAGAIGAVAILADHLSQSWTQAQAAAILQKITPNASISYTQMAQNLGKSRQVVTKSLDAAGYHVLAHALTTLEGDFS